MFVPLPVQGQPCARAVPHRPGVLLLDAQFLHDHEEKNQHPVREDVVFGDWWVMIPSGSCGFGSSGTARAHCNQSIGGSRDLPVPTDGDVRVRRH